jgi:hypothetical protein
MPSTPAGTVAPVEQVSAMSAKVPALIELLELLLLQKTFEPSVRARV